MSNAGKTAIILVGGGMRSAHGAGFLYALANDLLITAPDIMIGSSGNAGNVLYFASKQYESLEKIWCQLLSTPRFISLSRFWKVMDVDYLIDNVFKRQEPLATDALGRTSITWAIPITNFDTGASRYVTAADKIDPFEILRAAKAIPVFFGRRISLLGGKYFDGELGATAEDHINQAIERGAKRIVFINHAPRHTWESLVEMELFSATTPVALRHALLRDEVTHTIAFTLPDVQLLWIMPQNLPAHTATRNKDKLRKTFERGVQDALAHASELRTLLA